MTMEDVWNEVREPIPITPTKGALRRQEREARKAAEAELLAHWLPLLVKAAAQRDRAAEHYARKLARVRGLIRDANEAGVPMTEVAKAAGISRVRGHRIRDKSPAGALVPD